MARFAKIENGIVTDIILADQNFIDNKPNTEQWVEKTSNVGGIGWNYDPLTSTFYPPQPFLSWTLDTGSFEWNSPVEYPTDGKNYIWDEGNQVWIETELPI